MDKQPLRDHLSSKMKKGVEALNEGRVKLVTHSFSIGVGPPYRAQAGREREASVLNKF